MDDDMERVLRHPAGAAVDRFMPHQGRMKLLDELVAFDREQKTGDVALRLQADAPYFIDGIFQSHWLVEIIAQTGAVISQVLKSADADREPVPGFLIAINNFSRLDRNPLLPGELLRARIRFEVDLGPVGHCLGQVFREEGTLVAQGELTFFSSAEGGFS